MPTRERKTSSIPLQPISLLPFSASARIIDLSSFGKQDGKKRGLELVWEL
jgi:hypothetical protein